MALVAGNLERTHGKGIHGAMKRNILTAVRGTGDTAISGKRKAV